MYRFLQMGGGHPNTTGNVTNTSLGKPGLSGMACTSIVAQDETGHIFHGRNLDWNLPDDIRNMTVQVVCHGCTLCTLISTVEY